MDLINTDNIELVTVTMIFIVKDDSILTIKRAPTKKFYPNKISLIGGKVEPGEDIISSAKREAKEETNLNLISVENRGVFIRIVKDKYFNFIHILYSDKFEGELINDNEEGFVSWMKMDDFLHNPYTVEHIGLYFDQIVHQKNYYSGFGYYEGDKLLRYKDNSDFYKKS
ncbi:NUDIX domain-containing protein [Candidatus Dojkabacteria bacterium]|nr:NUDIX domain-containing protein [Candidatus Dojkabacteria bacterium]